jgi:hypothetical protein
MYLYIQSVILELDTKIYSIRGYTMNCQELNCNNKAHNTRIEYYHDGGGAIHLDHYCIEHTPEHNTTIGGRLNHTVWGKLLNFGDDNALYWWPCDGCNKYFDESELTWTDNENALYCPECQE